MTILIGRHEFEGPFQNLAELEDTRGLYAILHFEKEEYNLIHLGHAQNIREQTELSRSSYSSLPGNILIAACYTPKSSLWEREKMVADIIAEFDDCSADECDNLLTQIAV